MNNEEAIGVINTFRCKYECNTDGVDGCDEQEDCEYYLAIKALEKQMPKKPDYIYNEFYKSSMRWRCPNCTTMYAIDKDYYSWVNKANYCEFCGQAIDWNEE